LKKDGCSLLHHNQKIHELIFSFDHLLTHSTTNSGVVGAGACMYNYIFKDTGFVISFFISNCLHVLDHDKEFIRDRFDSHTRGKPKDAQKPSQRFYSFMFLSLVSCESESLTIRNKIFLTIPGIRISRNWCIWVVFYNLS
jgi:hypothetical protein